MNKEPTMEQLRINREILTSIKVSYGEELLSSIVSVYSEQSTGGLNIALSHCRECLKFLTFISQHEPELKTKALLATLTYPLRNEAIFTEIRKKMDVLGLLHAPEIVREVVAASLLKEPEIENFVIEELYKITEGKAMGSMTFGACIATAIAEVQRTYGKNSAVWDNLPRLYQIKYRKMIHSFKSKIYDPCFLRAVKRNLMRRKSEFTGDSK